MLFYFFSFPPFSFLCFLDVKEIIKQKYRQQGEGNTGACVTGNKTVPILPSK